MVVIAIENQFGLKYFNSCREDHLGTDSKASKDIITADPRVRTFGKSELETYIKRYFPEMHFFYPYPDYKISDRVMSSEFLESDGAGQVVSQMASRDYSGPEQPLWDEATTVLELARNRMLGFFSNSFLVVAGRSHLRGVAFDQLASLYSSGRRSEFATETRIVRSGPELDCIEAITQRRRRRRGWRNQDGRYRCAMGRRAIAADASHVTGKIHKLTLNEILSRAGSGLHD